MLDRRSRIPHYWKSLRRDKTRLTDRQPRDGLCDILWSLLALCFPMGKKSWQHMAMLNESFTVRSAFWALGQQRSLSPFWYFQYSQSKRKLWKKKKTMKATLLLSSAASTSHGGATDTQVRGWELVRKALLFQTNELQQFILGLVVVKNCTPTENAECSCAKNHYCSSPQCEHCESCTM